MRAAGVFLLFIAQAVERPPPPAASTSVNLTIASSSVGTIHPDRLHPPGSIAAEAANLIKRLQMASDVEIGGKRGQTTRST